MAIREKNQPPSVCVWARNVREFIYIYDIRYGWYARAMSVFIPFGLREEPHSAHKDRP